MGFLLALLGNYEGVSILRNTLLELTFDFETLLLEFWFYVYLWLFTNLLFFIGNDEVIFLWGALRLISSNMKWCRVDLLGILNND